MLIAVITGPDLPRATRTIMQVQTQVDLLEFRVDCFDDVHIVPALMKASRLPIILTLRSQQQGGKFSGTQKEAIAIYEKLAHCAPAYMDVDTEIQLVIVNNFRKRFPHIQWIYSYHDITQTPQNLSDIFADMQKAQADIYKIVTYAQKSCDALYMMNFIKTVNRKDLIAFCMGESGQWTRILAPIWGGMPMHYLANDIKNRVDGQLTVAQWQQDYQAPRVNKQTDIYALIGSPVSQSIGHLFHNQNFKAQGKNAVYVKILLEENELSTFFDCFKGTRLKGLSVTMPLKSAVLPFLDVCEANAQEAGAVNTLIFGDKILGKNTDGEGALQALLQKMTIQHKKIIILGAGNTARAIAIAAKYQGADVTLVARNIATQQGWAQQQNIPMISFAVFSTHPQDYDILINATPIGMTQPENVMPDWLVPEIFLPHKVVLDCVISNQETTFLRFAAARECQCIAGVEMFFAQARLQF